MVREFGADAVRLYLLAASQVWLPKRFDARAIPEAVGGFLNTLKQTYRFFALYAGEERPARGARRRRDATSTAGSLARLDATTEQVTAAWEGYDVTAGVRAILELVDDLSNWYVRLSRARFWAPDREADPAAVATLHEALVTVARLLAPAAPFASDWLHRALEDGALGAPRRLPGEPRPARPGARDRDGRRAPPRLARARGARGGGHPRAPAPRAPARRGAGGACAARPSTACSRSSPRR